jgi:hypothetical protein
LASHSTFNNVQGARHNTVNVNVNNTFGGDRTSHSLHLNDESLRSCNSSAVDDEILTVDVHRLWFPTSENSIPENDGKQTTTYW